MIVRRTGIAALVWIAAVPGVASAQERGFEIAFTLGQSLFDAGPTGTPLSAGGGASIFRAGEGVCDGSGAFLTNFNAQAGYGPVAVDLSYNHTDWPWDYWTGAGGGPGGGAEGGGGSLQDFVQRHGDSYEGVVLVRPAEIFDLGFTHRTGYTFQPLLGAGVQITTDADDTSPSGGLPLYLAQGQTNVLLAYGFTLDVHPGSLSERGFGFRVQLLGKRALRDEAPFSTPSGDVTLETEDANWASLTLGVVFRPGGFRGFGEG